MKTRTLAVRITETDMADLERLCAAMGITKAKLVHEAISGYLAAGRQSGILKRKKASVADLMAMFAAGMKLNP
jgi:hypothetical protein